MNKINVLSLFDGLGGARIALDRLGIECNYYSSEIDKYAIKIAMKNYFDIIQLGDIKYIRGSSLPKINLLIGGSPCQDLSISKKDRKGLEGERSSLFYEYVRLLKEIKPRYFILENVNSMSKENKQIISNILGVDFIMINSTLLTAQNRKRLYWVGELVDGKYVKVEIPQPEDKYIYLKDILEEDVDEKYYIKNISLIPATQSVKNNALKFLGGIRNKDWAKDGKTYSRNFGQGDRVYSIDGKSATLSANGGGRGAKTGLYCVVQKDNQVIKIDKIKPYIRKLTPIECERLQGLKDNQTEGVSNSQRYKMIGNGFTVSVIEHILKHINWEI